MQIFWNYKMLLVCYSPPLLPTRKANKHQPFCLSSYHLSTSTLPSLLFAFPSLVKGCSCSYLMLIPTPVQHPCSSRSSLPASWVLIPFSCYAYSFISSTSPPPSLFKHALRSPDIKKGKNPLSHHYSLIGTSCFSHYCLFCSQPSRKHKLCSLSLVAYIPFLPELTVV